MKIYTNKNNTSTLKLLIAANLAGKKVEIVDATFEDDVFSGPRSLPLLYVDEQLSFFSSNVAAQYLVPVVDLSHSGQCQQIQEWEATRLQPAVAAVLAGKTPSDLKQALIAMVQTIDTMLQKNKYILGDKLSVADISIWSTLYPLSQSPDLRTQYISECAATARWADELLGAKAVQSGVQQWGGSPAGPFGAASALGAPHVAALGSPIGSPDEGSAEVGPSPEELEAARDAWHNGLSELQAPHTHEKVVLPLAGRRNVLVTSALPYVNNVPHLGNIIGCVLSADIFARYCRICDYNTLYICGTDEYGTATETKAIEEGVSPKEVCDKYFAIHSEVYRWFNIGFDYFGRTSTPDQTQIAQKMFLKLKDNGFISAQTVDQLKCQKCDRFLADRFVEGTCPHPGCQYEGARGDQCDACGKLINAVELGAPRCKLCHTTPVVTPSQQLFIELPALEPSIRTWAATQEQNWSPPARAVTRSWLREPLRSRAVTRDLKWGVNVPVPGFENKVFYVWFDAPIGYMSITQAATGDYEKWWKPDKDYDVKLYQFMAKDNVPFHAVMFPATLLGVNEGHLMVNYLYATEYLNYEEGKFSKSRGVGVFGTDARAAGLPPDVWRFYLASARPETSDSAFSWTELGTRNNSELLNNLGNFCHRSLSFCASAFQSRVPPAALSPSDYNLLALVNRELSGYVLSMERGRLRGALRHVLAVARLGNQHMQAEQPWALLKGSDDDKVRGATAVSLCVQLAALLCALAEPYMPDTARRLRGQLNVPRDRLRINSAKPSFFPYLAVGHQLGKPEPLFAKIEQELLDRLRAQYAGTQAERAPQQNGGVGAGSSGSVAELEATVAKQADKVRQIKSSTKDKAAVQPEVDKLLALKKQLAAAQAQPAAHASAGDSVQSLEKAVAAQADKVRQIKSSTKDKAVVQPEVDKLLALKKQLAAAQAQPAAQASAGDSVESLEKAVAAQADKVRQIKSSTKDKAVVQPEVDKLLALKKQLAAAQAQPAATPAPPAPAGDSVQLLEKAIAEQGDKVRKIKASTKDKAVWQPEVTALLDLKKRLAALQLAK